VAQEGELYSTHSCGYQEEVVEAMEDLQQTSEGVDGAEVPVDVLRLQRHHPDPSVVSEPAACLSDVSS
jgi:hypothetical protein